MGAIAMIETETVSRQDIRPGDLLTPGQLAKFLQVKVSWVYEASRRRGRFSADPLPLLRCGRYLRFFKPEILAWMRRNGGK